MKPIQEQEWTEYNTQSSVCEVRDGALFTVARLVPNAETRRAIAALPDMARALLGLMPEHPRPGTGELERHTPTCWECIHAYHVKSGCGHDTCEAAHAALRKGGFL